MIQIVQSIRGYKTSRARKIALKLLFKTGKYNHFVLYWDNGSHLHPYAIQYGKADWVRAGEWHVDW